MVVTARGREALDAIEAKVTVMGGTALGLQAEAGSVADSERVIKEASSRFGRIDILVNNAAVFPGRISIEISKKVWDETLDTDLKGAFFLSKLAALQMIEGGRGGRIINIPSTEIRHPTGLLAADGAAKAGLLAITQSMAKELDQYGIQVNAVIPGSTMTAKRIEAFKSGKGVGPSQAVPPDATKTQEKLRDMLEKVGWRSPSRTRCPWADRASLTISPRRYCSWRLISQAMLAVPRSSSTAPRRCLKPQHVTFVSECTNYRGGQGQKLITRETHNGPSFLTV